MSDRGIMVLAEAEMIVQSLREKGFDPAEVATILSFSIVTVQHQVGHNLCDGLSTIENICASARVQWRSFHDAGVRSKMLSGKHAYSELMREELAKR